MIEAIAEYIPYLSGKEKTVKQSTSTLNELVKMLGENFNMRFFDNDLVKHFWLDPKLEQTLTGAKNPKKASTIKREFSPILGFSRWATDKKYCPAPLTLTVKRGESEHYDYFKSDDLKIIFDKLVTEATQDWHIWIPAISLFTGGRIGEIAELKTEHFFNKAELEIMHLPGTKNDCAPRDVPIHNDLIDMGLLKHVENRRKLKKEYLFNISNESENGRGGTASKAFGYFKRAKCGITQKTKSHHSFRHTIIDHLKQHESNPEIRRQFMGHAQSKDVHDTVYGRQGFALAALKREVNDKIDWQKYCNWTPNLEALGKAAAELTGANKAKETRPTITRRSPKKLSQT